MTTERVLHIRIIPTNAAIAAVKQQFAMLDRAAASSPQPPVLSLPSIDAYYALLTPRRLDLLRALRGDGPLSIRALSRQLQRDYKNVHTDTVALIESGLVERDATNRVSTPWDRFEVSLPLRDVSVEQAA